MLCVRHTCKNGQQQVSALGEKYIKDSGKMMKVFFFLIRRTNEQYPQTLRHCHFIYLFQTLTFSIFLQMTYRYERSLIFQ